MENKILVVDDEEQILDVLRRALSKAGYQVYCATNVNKALEILQQERIEVFFLDIQLPGTNGLKFCQQIRERLPLYCIYALTGHASLYDVRMCREAGFDDYFTKPVPLDLIVKAAQEAFEKLERWKANSH